MLDLMRKKAGSWMIKFILGAIIVVFAFWGVGSFNARRLNTIATVGDTIITFEEYRDAYDRMVEQMRERFGGQLDAKMIEALNLKQQAIEQIVNDRLLINEAKRLGLRVTNEELTRAIGSLGAFQRDGRFAPDLYRRLLEANRMNPESFEQEQRQAMLIGKLRSVVSDTVQVSDSEARRWYDFINAKVALDYVSFDPDKYSDLTVSEDEVAAYYKNHKEEYKTAPLRSVKYLFFGVDDFKDRATVSEDEVRDYYDGHQSDFRQEASVEARHVLILTGPDDNDEAVEAARQKALAVMEKARAGEDFAELARQNSQDGTAANGGELGRFTRGQMVKPFADKAFSMKAGEISEPVRTKFGWHVIKVEQVHPAQTRSLEEVGDEIRARLKTVKAKSLAFDAADATWGEAFDANDLKSVAESRGLKLHTSARFDRKGPSDSSIADKAKFAEAAFALTDNSVSDVVEMPDGYYILQLNEEIPSEIPPLEALAEAVRADAKVAKQRDKARQAAQEMLDAVRGGQDFAAAAKAREQVVQNTGLFGRQGPVGSIGMAGELAAAAFRLSKDAPMPETVFNVKQRWYVVRFDQRESPDDAGFGSQKERIMAQLRQQKQYQALDALLARLRTQSRIDIKNDML